MMERMRKKLEDCDTQGKKKKQAIFNSYEKLTVYLKAVQIEREICFKIMKS